MVNAGQGRWMGCIYGKAVVSLYEITIMRPRFVHTRRVNRRLAIRYGDEPWRFVTAFVAAVATGLVAYPRGTGEETQTTNFLALVAIYFFIAYVGLAWIKIFTIWLDRWFPWPGFPNSRLVFQLFCCWLVPVLLVYGLARSVLALPQLAPLVGANPDFRETAAVLVLSFGLSFNIAYICAYFIALCQRLQRKAQQGLRLIKLSRQRSADHPMHPYRKATLDKKTDLLSDSPLDGKYQHVTPFKTELLDYRDISEFVLKAHMVFICREGKDKETAKQRSLKEVEIVTAGYFRKVGRNRAIPQHRLKRCVSHGAQLELTLFPDDETVTVSEDYATQIKGWVLSRVGIERG